MKSYVNDEVELHMAVYLHSRPSLPLVLAHRPLGLLVILLLRLLELLPLKQHFLFILSEQVVFLQNLLIFKCFSLLYLNITMDAYILVPKH